ncbi:MAG: NAD(+)/NADH kinase [Pirellulales bacterium]
MNEFDDVLTTINEKFVSAFGSTPLPERVQDLLAQAHGLSRYTHVTNLRDEAGDLLCSLLQLCNECDWRPNELIAETLSKIDRRSDIYHRLGRKLRVALLGGAFDPIHVGHLHVVREILRSGAVDEVWIMPCYEHLGGKVLAPVEDRLEMCRLAVEGERGIGVFDYEIRQKFRGETYHLVKMLLADELALDRCEFSFVLGQDNADTIMSWTGAETLMRMMRFIVLPRAGSLPPPPRAWYLQQPHRFLDQISQQPAVSSTEVRHRLRKNDESVGTLVPNAVHEYLVAKRLYRAPVVSGELRRKKVAIYASTFDPPSKYHRRVVESILAKGFDEVLIRPAGPRPRQLNREHAISRHRAALIDLNFQDLPGVRIDLSDLELSRFTPPKEYEKAVSQSNEVWHVVNSDLIRGGQQGTARIQQEWDHGSRLWNESQFLVLQGSPESVRQEDLPPRHCVLQVSQHVPSAELRNRIYNGQPVGEWVHEAVESYIERHGLFLSSQPSGAHRLRITDPRILLEFDERNAKSIAFADRYRRWVSDDPNLILVVGGDGTMLRAIRRHWRRRLPILGLNAGHLGFLANETLPEDLTGGEFVSYSLPMLRVDQEADDGTKTKDWLSAIHGSSGKEAKPRGCNSTSTA